MAGALIALYGLGAVVYGWVFPGLSDDAMGAHVDLFYGGFTVLFLAVIAATSGWRAVGLVGRDRHPVVRWIVVLAVVDLLFLLSYFAASLLGYSGQEGAVWIILVNLAFVAFNEEVLFRGFLWSAIDTPSPAQRILIVSLVFGLFHLVNGFTGESWGSALFQVVLVFLASILDGVVRYGTGSLWPTIVLHFLWDASGVLGAGSVADVLGPVLQFAIVVAGLVALAVIATRRGGEGRSSAAVATRG